MPAPSWPWTYDQRGAGQSTSPPSDPAYYTLEKYVPEYSDQDSDIASYIRRNFEDLDLTKDDAVDLAYLCAIPEGMEDSLPDCSLRHMLEIDRKLDQCALESHLAFVAGMLYSPMELDHGECINTDFYDYIEQRFSKFERARN